MTKSKTPREKARDDRKPVGRPTVFTQEILEKILDLISGGLTEHAVSKLDGMPSWSAWCYFKRWAKDNDAEFMSKLAQATDDWCTFQESKRHEIAEDQTRDVMDVEEITESEKHGTTIKRKKVSDNTAIQRDRLRVDVIENTLKWKLPQKYGDKAQVTHQNPDGSGLSVIVNISRKSSDKKKD